MHYNQTENYLSSWNQEPLRRTKMADFQLLDDQNVTLTLALEDAEGNAVTGDTLDAGSVTATFADGSEFTAVVSADQTTVLVTATGALTIDDVLTVTGSLNGVALTPGTLAFDVDASTATAIGLTPGTPVQNA
jgi:hypothetical protein